MLTSRPKARPELSIAVGIVGRQDKNAFPCLVGRQSALLDYSQAQHDIANQRVGAQVTEQDCGSPFESGALTIEILESE